MFILEILMPQKKILNIEVKSVVLPGLEGTFQILSNHANIFSLLKPGLISFVPFDSNELLHKCHMFRDVHDFKLVISDGFVEVNSIKTSVLCSYAYFSSELSIEDYKEEIKSIKLNINSCFNKQIYPYNYLLKKAEACLYL